MLHWAHCKRLRTSSIFHRCRLLHLVEGQWQPPSESYCHYLSIVHTLGRALVTVTRTSGWRCNRGPLWNAEYGKKRDFAWKFVRWPMFEPSYFRNLQAQRRYLLRWHGDFPALLNAVNRFSVSWTVPLFVPRENSNFNKTDTFPHTPCKIVRVQRVRECKISWG